MNMNQDQIERLRRVLAAQEKSREPWTTGVVELAKAEQTLFFKCKDGSSRCIDLGLVNEQDAKALVAACDPAPFDHRFESVLDGTCHKAWKLDPNNFCWLFSPERWGSFVARLAQGFCPWDHFDTGVSVQISHLNVYEKGGFFKIHKDTPHTENFFGSLVFVLPTEHQGGSLLLRHRERELNFDAPVILKDAPPGSMAYAAFYSDVEHQVLEVMSGHRVTITFNLYYDSMKTPPILPSDHLKVPENPFTVALRELLQDCAFIEKHKYLGFGLESDYPEGAEDNYYLDDCLEGPDKYLFRVLSDIGARPALMFLYESHEHGSGGFWVMRNHRILGREVYSASEDTELHYVMGKKDGDDGFIVWKEGRSEKSTMRYNFHPWVRSYFKNVKYYRSRTITVDWVTPPYANLDGLTEYSEDEGEPNQEIFEFRVCIVVDTNNVNLSA